MEENENITTYLKAMENEDIMYLINMIYECEFDILINENGTLSLEDLQNANLGNIEEEEFETITDICERMESTYFDDYHFENEF